MKLSRLTDDGISRFHMYLDALKENPAMTPPVEMLSDARTSTVVANIELEQMTFANRLEAATYINGIFEGARLADSSRDKGLWAWLSLFFFDQVCPPDGHGKRKPGETARHIPDASNYQRYYRHLLAGPWRVFRAHRDSPERALVALCQPVHTPGDLVEQLASRHELVTNRAFLDAATRLYVDAGTRMPKRGAGGKAKGSARRLADLCNQFDVTWDLYSMTSDEFLAKLPSEFDRFRNAN